MGFETNDINGEIIGGNNKKTISITLDGDYVSTTSHPSWAVLGFRTVIGKLLSYFKGGNELWAVISASVKTSSGTGRFYYKDEVNGVAYGLWSLDVNTIVWQSANIVRFTFNSSPDLSSVSVGENYHSDSATNSSNNGDFEILAVDNTAKWIAVDIPARSDGTDDEATDSPATGETGSVTQFTNTSFAIITSKPFKITEETYSRMRLNKSTGSGTEINGYELILFTK